MQSDAENTLAQIELSFEKWRKLVSMESVGGQHWSAFMLSVFLLAAITKYLKW